MIPLKLNIKICNMHITEIRHFAHHGLYLADPIATQYE